MRLSALALALPVLGACSGQSSPDEPSCPFAATAVSPATGATGIFVDSDYDPILVTFDQEGVELFVRDDTEREIPGSDSVDGMNHKWTVSGSLATNATHQVWGRKDDCELPISTFTTGPWRFADLQDSVYVLDLDAATGLGLYSLNLVTDQGVNLAFWSRDSVNDFWTSVPVEGNDQDFCQPTTDLTGGFSNSKLTFQLRGTPFGGDPDEPIRWNDTTVTALVPTDDLSVWERVRIQGELDLSFLASEGADCSIFDSFGEECGPCASGGGSICMTVDVTGATAKAIPLDPVQHDGRCGE